MKYIHLFLTLLVFSFSGCASIPKEAPLLSEQLGKEVSELESSHFRLVTSFFDLKRKNVRDYLDRVWLPLYAETFFNKPDIKEMWERVSSAGSEKDRLMFLLTTAPILQADINRQYQNSVQDLDLLERELKEALRQKYSNARSINNTLTSFLVSAAEVDQNRQRYMNMAGLTEDKIGAVIEQTEILTSKFLQKAIDADKKVEGAEENLAEYGEKLRSLIQKLK